MQRLPKIIWILLCAGGLAIAFFFFYYDQISGKQDNGLGPMQKVGILVGIGLFLVAGNYAFKSLLYYLALSMLILGTFLLGLNIYGGFVSLRNPKVNLGAWHFNKFRVPQKTPEQVFAEMDKRPDETYQEYAHRLTDLIYGSTIHKWDTGNYTEYNHQVPPHENYLLWLLSYVDPNDLYYHFCDPRKAIERGVMICSQATQVMVSLWQKTGLLSSNWALDGHVVAEVQVDQQTDTWWVLDADFGVVLDHDIATLEQHPEIVVKSYTDAGYDRNVAEQIAGIYGKEGNYIQTTAGLCRMEDQLYKWKWYIPFGLLSLSTLYFGAIWILSPRSTNSI